MYVFDTGKASKTRTQSFAFDDKSSAFDWISHFSQLRLMKKVGNPVKRTWFSSNAIKRKKACFWTSGQVEVGQIWSDFHEPKHFSGAFDEMKLVLK
jgi:hypothetical protein